MAKYSKNFDRDYEFYMRHLGRFQFAGGAEIPEVPFDENGVDAKRAFHKFDSNGKLVPCNEPELFKNLLTTKKGINFHFKMWAEGFNDFREPIDYYLDEFDDPPKWVRSAFIEQVAKQHVLRHKAEQESWITDMITEWSEKKNESV